MEKEKFIQILLIVLIVLLFIDLVFLNINVFFKSDKGFVNPLVTTIEKVKEVEKESDKIEIASLSTIDYLDLCKKEISRALATVSGETTEVVKTVYQQVPAENKPTVLYIPLGGGVSTTNRDWSYVGGAEGYFDKADYKNAKKISFEVFLRIKHAAGQASARLYDTNHGFVISNSELSAGAESFTLVSSPALEFLDGNNLYKVELRSTTGYEAFMDGARIKVDF